MSDRRQRQKHRGVAKIFAIPALIGIFAGVGLTSALIGDGLWDAVSWLFLGVPIGVLTYLSVLTRRRPR